jgi:oligoribonuclease NrnB/cAMP/cGMP phosphodiesterase (DHH superfamily)
MRSVKNILNGGGHRNAAGGQSSDNLELVKNLNQYYQSIKTINTVNNKMRKNLMFIALATIGLGKLQRWI